MINPFTQHMLKEAGITTGMNVLDLGCGPGEVSLIAAELVGATGSVLGIDTNPDVLQLAHARAQDAGFKHASFLASDIRELALDQEYDAIVGRLILLYLPERLAILRRLTQHLRPGGVVAFQEYDMAGAADTTLPHSPFFEQVWTWMTQAFQRAGVEIRMGMKLHSTFLEADLPAPHLRHEADIGAGPDWLGYEVLANVVRALLPLIVKFGIATAEEVDIETLADRLREEIVSHNGVARSPALISAWVRKS
jgi:SAM-dependent methyltransferase